jgi:hypothetical protein
LDRQVLEKLNVAERLVVDSLKLVEEASREVEREERGRYRRVQDDLLRLARSFESVRQIGPVFSMEPEVKPAPKSAPVVRERVVKTPPVRSESVQAKEEWSEETDR